MRKSIYFSTLSFFLAIAIFSGIKIHAHFKEAHEQEELYDNLAQIVGQAESVPTLETISIETNEPESESPENTEPVVLTAYAELYEQNNDMIGWIRIEDTRVNYPVMQSPYDSDFYLNHGFDKGETDYGCPYVPKICNVNKPSDNLIIYGHHKKNGSMFSDLKKFQKKSFWEDHKTITFDTIYERQTYEIVAVFKTVVYTNSEHEFKYYQFTDANAPEEFDAYIARCKEMAFYDTGVSAEYGDKLITLSTCEYSNRNGRLVLVAKKVDN